MNGVAFCLVGIPPTPSPEVSRHGGRGRRRAEGVEGTQPRKGAQIRWGLGRGAPERGGAHSPENNCAGQKEGGLEECLGKEAGGRLGGGVLPKCRIVILARKVLGGLENLTSQS